MSGRGSSRITDAGTESIDHRYEWSRQLRFASLSQIWRSNSKVVHDTITDDSICELYALRNCHITDEEFRLDWPLDNLAKEAQTHYINCAQAVGESGGGLNGQQGQMTMQTCAVGACAATVLSGHAGSDRDPPPKSAEASSGGSGLLGSFWGSADIFYAFFMFSKGVKQRQIAVIILCSLNSSFSFKWFF